MRSGVGSRHNGLLEIVLQEKLLVETGCLAHVCSDHHVVLSCVSIRFGRKLETGLLCCVACLADLRDDLSVVLRVADYCNCAPVLSC